MGHPNRRRSRVLVLVAGTLLVTGVAVGAWALRESHLDRTAVDARERGVAAIGRADWSVAIDGLGRYIQRFAEDGRITAEDHRLYARARRNVVLPNGRHLSGAIWSLRRSLEMDPSNAEAQQELLDLYVTCGWTTEALAHVETMLSRAPSDAALLKTKRDVLESTRAFPAALEVSRGLDAASPQDLSSRFHTLELLFLTQEEEREIGAWVEREIAAQPSDARFRLLRAAFRTRLHDEEGAKEELDGVLAATTESRDGPYVVLLVRELDAAGRFDDSVGVLDDVRDTDDPELRREVVRRLWCARRFGDIAAIVESWGADPKSLDSEVLALHALSLETAGRSDDARPFRATLDARETPVDRAWAVFVRSRAQGDDSDPTAHVLPLRDAVRTLPRNPLLRLALGDGYAALGEMDLAMDAWSEAAARAPAWSDPLVRMARTLIATGREQAAPAVARAAVRRAPNDVEAMATYVRAVAGSGELDAAQTEKLLGAATALAESDPGSKEEMLALTVDALGRIDPAKAEERIRAVLSSDTRPAETTLLRLADVARRRGLEHEESLYELCESLHGSSPRLALSRALSRAGRGSGGTAGPAGSRASAEAGLALLDEAAARAKDGASLDWAIARASYLDAVRDPRAGAAWVELADANEKSLAVQLGALASNAAWRDRDSVARVVERLRGLTGDEAISWKVARARWLLDAPTVTQADAAEAARLLGESVRAAPRSLPSRLLLARALETLGNLTAAEEQLRLASDLAPDDPWAALEIARVAQRQGRHDLVKRQLDRILAAKDVSPRHVHRAAWLLARQGDLRRTADVLDPLSARPDARVDELTFLAEVYARLGEPDRALALCERLLPTGSPAVLELAANLHAAAGRPADADALLQRIDATDLPPGDRELARGRHAAAFGAPGAAREWYRKACVAAPARADAWIALLADAVGAGDRETVESVLDDTQANHVEPVKFLREQRDVCRALDDPRVRALVAASLQEPQHRAALVTAIRTLVRGNGDAGSRLAAARALRRLADANARVLAIHLVAADSSAASGELRDACDLACRAAEQFPSSAVVASQAAELLARCGRWEETLEAARTWRDRAPAHDLRPTVLTAEALLRLGRSAEAVQTLEPRVQPALARPDRYEALLLDYAVALARSGAAGRADELLGGLAATSERWRTLPLEVAPEMLGDAATAAAWVRARETTLVASGGDTPDARLRLARSWVAAWSTFGTHELRSAAKDAVARVTASKDAPAAAWFLAASVAQREGDLEGARTGYLAALERDSALVEARNNLAMVLADSGRWKAAVDEATTATRARPDDANCHDTLAYAFRKGAAFDRAKACALEAIRLQPTNPAWHLSLAETLVESGEVDAAAGVLTRIDEIVAGGVRLSGSAGERLDRLRKQARGGGT